MVNTTTWHARLLLLRGEHISNSVNGYSKPYQATRDMRRIRDSLQDIPELDKRIVLLELDHTV